MIVKIWRWKRFDFASLAPSNCYQKRNMLTLPKIKKKHFLIFCPPNFKAVSKILFFTEGKNKFLVMVNIFQIQYLLYVLWRIQSSFYLNHSKIRFILALTTPPVLWWYNTKISRSFYKKGEERERERKRERDKKYTRRERGRERKKKKERIKEMHMFKTELTGRLKAFGKS